MSNQSGYKDHWLTKQPEDEGLDETSFEIFELRDLALRALPKREMIRLLTLAGIPPMKSEDRRRELMASRLAHIADRVTILIRWDHRMQNAERTRGAKKGRKPTGRLVAVV